MPRKGFRMKTYLVTGGSSGIGKAIALKLASENQVIIIGLDEDRLHEVAGQQKQIIPLKFDLYNLKDIRNIFELIDGMGYKLDGLIHSAGVAMSVPIGANDIEQMKQVMTVNCMAFAELMKYFSKKKYSNNGSSVVAISSLAAYVCTKGTGIYAASKSALNNLVKVSAKELTKRHIRVNAVMPAFVQTSMISEKDDQLDELIRKEQPWGVIEPEQVAELVTFLLSDNSQMITGATIPITGGRVV